MTQASEIEQLETRFWQSMIDKDAKTAGTMIADISLVSGPMGTMRIDPAKYEKMTKEGQWTLEKFTFSDVDVVFPADDVAIIAYQVHQTGTMKGERMDMKCADSSTWIRTDGTWKCALHTETILGKPGG